MSSEEYVSTNPSTVQAADEERVLKAMEDKPEPTKAEARQSVGEMLALKRQMRRQQRRDYKHMYTRLKKHIQQDPPDTTRPELPDPVTVGGGVQVQDDGDVVDDRPRDRGGQYTSLAWGVGLAWVIGTVFFLGSSKK